MKPLVVVSAAVVLTCLARRRALRWGATSTEVAARLPGDAVVPGPDLVATRAITIAAQPEAVMPWLRQLGHGRGGFYSYDGLENLLGLGIHSADVLVAAWQHSEVGDDVHLAPEVPLRIVELTPEAMVLHGVVAPGARGEAPYDFSWTFAVLPHARGSRLVVRERYAYRRPWVALVVEPVSAVSWLMTQRMLRGVRDRAERAARP